MELINMLSVKDEAIISEWIKMYGVSRRDYNSFPVEEINLANVLRAWDTNKSEHLWHLLGKQFIIEREVSYQRPDALLDQQLDDAMNHSKMYDFRDKLYIEFENLFQYFSSEFHCLRRLFDVSTLRENHYSGASCRIIKDDLHIDVMSGAKPMKVFNKLAKYFHLENEFEAFRIEHSQILNQKTLTGTLCLSIHPFDFMTMSDNSYNWDSCMNWEHPGCYRTGTIEMMNSPYMVLAYLKGSDPYRVGSYQWEGNKKWRQLIVVHPHAITDIKGYPYHSDALSSMALDWIRELASVNLGWNVSYDPIEYNPYEYFSHKDGHTYLYDFSFTRMYNDFCTSNTNHKIIIPQGWQTEEYEKEYIELSGPNICVCCGEEWDPCEGNEDMVMCWDCDPGPRCSCCNELLCDDESYYVDGDCLCPVCYDEYADWCPIDEEYHYNDNLQTLYLTAVDDNVAHYETLNIINVPRNYISNGIPSYNRGMFNGLKEFHKANVNGEIIYYVNMKECNSYVLEECFGLWSVWNKERYIQRYKERYCDNS